jgi:hypothetical protein
MHGYTSSTTAQMVMGDALAVALMEVRGFNSDDFAKFHPGGSLGKKLYMKVHDLSMHNQRPAVKADTQLKEVIMEMTDSGKKEPEKKEPPKKVGFGYMLQGESAASNVDPFAQPPTDMKDLSKWHQAGPHIMIFNPAAGGMTGYVKPGENADVTQPWVMWAGSPYEHLMIPTE